jgi:hypothetical protein
VPTTHGGKSLAQETDQRLFNWTVAGAIEGCRRDLSRNNLATEPYKIPGVLSSHPWGCETKLTDLFTGALQD